MVSYFDSFDKDMPKAVPGKMPYSLLREKQYRRAH
jgi:hypothetical protein